jgi:hypothetical protein
MSEPLPTIVTAGAQSGAVMLASAASGVDANLLQILIAATGGALMCRVIAPMPEVPLTAFKAFAIFVCSIMMAGAFGEFAVSALVNTLNQDWLQNTKQTRWTVGFVIGLSAQAIAEVVQSLPKLAQTNLVEAVKAIFSRFSGKGAQ